MQEGGHANEASDFSNIGAIDRPKRRDKCSLKIVGESVTRVSALRPEDFVGGHDFMTRGNARLWNLGC